MKKISTEQAKQKAGRFCALRERSPVEVFNKLTRWGLTDMEAESVLEALTEDGFIDEQRFANAYCHDRFEFDSWGKQKIRAHIHPHQISTACMEQALQQISDDKYMTKIESLATKKWNLIKEEDTFKRKQKVLNYMLNKGFEPEWSWKSINNMVCKRQSNTNLMDDNHPL